MNINFLGVTRIDGSGHQTKILQITMEATTEIDEKRIKQILDAAIENKAFILPVIP